MCNKLAALIIVTVLIAIFINDSAVVAFESGGRDKSPEEILTKIANFFGVNDAGLVDVAKKFVSHAGDTLQHKTSE